MHSLFMESLEIVKTNNDIPCVYVGSPPSSSPLLSPPRPSLSATFRQLEEQFFLGLKELHFWGAEGTSAAQIGYNTFEIS